MRKGLILLSLLLMLAGALYAQPAGIKWPMRVIDSSTGEPVTGAWIYASTWEARPPVKVGGSATEQGGGLYYFVLGSCDSCIPNGYYDIWVNNELDSARAGLPIFPAGSCSLACNTINTCHIIDDEVLLDEDMENDYGSVSAQTGTIYDINYDTQLDANEFEPAFQINVEDHGTGTDYSGLSGLQVNHIVTGKNDWYNSPRGILVSMVTDSDNPAHVVDAARGGPVAFSGRVRCETNGWGSRVTVARSSHTSGSLAAKLPYWSSSTGDKEIGAHRFEVVADTLGAWWGGAGTISDAYGIDGRVYATHTKNLYGMQLYIVGDSSVTNLTGISLTTNGWLEESGYPLNNILVGGTAYGEETSYGSKLAAWGMSATARTYGGVYYALQDTTLGQGDYTMGIYAEAHGNDTYGTWYDYSQGVKRADGGYFKAGADTAYGVRAMAVSDLDNAGNSAIGVLGSAGSGPINIGVKGEAVRSTVGATNIGIYGTAANGATDYAGYFDGPVYLGGPITLDDTGGDATCGLATVPSGADTVRVSTTYATGKNACIVTITPHGRSPDATWGSGNIPYVARITGGAFTVYCDTTQTADQEFFWRLDIR